MSHTWPYCGWSVSGALIFLTRPWARRWKHQYRLCHMASAGDAKSTSTFPVCTGTKLYCLETEHIVREQLVQRCPRKCGGLESNPRTVDCKSSAMTTRPPSHTTCQWYDGSRRKQKRKEGRKEDTQNSGKLAIRPDHPRHRIKIKLCMVGGLRCVVILVKCDPNRLRGYGAVGGRKWPFPITLASGLCNSLYYRTSRD